MGTTNYRKLFSIQSNIEKILKTACPEIDNKSGIYFLIRTDEDENKKYIYLGKGVNLIRRMCSHIQGYQQHIDISLKKRGLFSSENPSGWKLNVLHFPEEELDEKERYYIDLYKNAGFILLNIENGGTKGKTDINERKLGKGYYDGVKQGYTNAQRYVGKLFEKNLIFSINGTPNKNKQRAYDKFDAFLKENK